MTGPDYSEVIVKRNSTVASCLQCILERAKITGKTFLLLSLTKHILFYIICFVFCIKFILY